ELGDKLAGMLDRALHDTVDPVSDALHNIENLFSTAEHRASPLILDLNGSGTATSNVHLSNVNDADARYFDLHGDAFSERTGVAKDGDGVLCIDRNGNGRIDGASEGFGDQTGKSNGFIDLAQMDSNHDGKITAEDQRFSSLKVWIDSNADGVSQTE